MTTPLRVYSGDSGDAEDREERSNSNSALGENAVARESIVSRGLARVALDSTKKTYKPKNNVDSVLLARFAAERSLEERLSQCKELLGAMDNARSESYSHTFLKHPTNTEGISSGRDRAALRSSLIVDRAKARLLTLDGYKTRGIRMVDQWTTVPKPPSLVLWADLLRNEFLELQPTKEEVLSNMVKVAKNHQGRRVFTIWRLLRFLKHPRWVNVLPLDGKPGKKAVLEEVNTIMGEWSAAKTIIQRLETTENHLSVLHGRSSFETFGKIETEKDAKAEENEHEGQNQNTQSNNSGNENYGFVQSSDAIWYIEELIKHQSNGRSLLHRFLTRLSWLLHTHRFDIRQECAMAVDTMLEARLRENEILHSDWNINDDDEDGGGGGPPRLERRANSVAAVIYSLVDWLGYGASDQAESESVLGYKFALDAERFVQKRFNVQEESWNLQPHSGSIPLYRKSMPTPSSDQDQVGSDDPAIDLGIGMAWDSDVVDGPPPTSINDKNENEQDEEAEAGEDEREKEREHDHIQSFHTRGSQAEAEAKAAKRKKGGAHRFLKFTDWNSPIEVGCAAIQSQETTEATIQRLRIQKQAIDVLLRVEAALVALSDPDTALQRSTDQARGHMKSLFQPRSTKDIAFMKPDVLKSASSSRMPRDEISKIAGVPMAKEISEQMIFDTGMGHHSLSTREWVEDEQSEAEKEEMKKEKEKEKNDMMTSEQLRDLASKHKDLEDSNVLSLSDRRQSSSTSRKKLEKSYASTSASEKSKSKSRVSVASGVNARDEIDQESLDALYALRLSKLRDLRFEILSYLNYSRAVERRIVVDEGELEESGINLNMNGNGNGSGNAAHDKNKNNGPSKQQPQQQHGHPMSNVDPHWFTEKSKMQAMQTSMNVNLSGEGDGNGNEVRNSHGHHQYQHDIWDDSWENENVHIEKRRTRLNNLPVVIDGSSGWPIMYDKAFKDFEAVQNTLLRIGSLFLSRSSVVATSDGSDMVDRKAVMCDLLESEAAFQRVRCKLIGQFMRAYESSGDHHVSIGLVNRIKSLLVERPILDLDASYFVESYIYETAALAERYELLGKVFSTISHLNNFDFVKPAASEAVWRVDSILEKAIDATSRFLRPSNPLASSLLKRAVIRQGSAEWETILEETKSKVRAGGDDSSVYLVSDLEKPVHSGSIRVACEELAKDAINRQGEVATADLLEQYISHYLMNSIEMLWLREDIVGTLYESDILDDLYSWQASIMGHGSEGTTASAKSGRSGKNSDDSSTALGRRRGLQVSGGTNSMSTVVKHQYFGSLGHSKPGLNLAIAAIDASLAEIRFDNVDSLKKCIRDGGLKIVRASAQTQRSYRSLVSAAALSNDVMIEPYLSLDAQIEDLSYKRDPGVMVELFPADAILWKPRAGKFVPENANQTSRAHDALNARKRAEYRKLLDRFSSVAESSFQARRMLSEVSRFEKHDWPDAGGNHLMWAELKGRLARVNQYCRELLQLSRPFLLRAQAALIAAELRGFVSLMPGVDSTVGVSINPSLSSSGENAPPSVAPGNAIARSNSPASSPTKSPLAVSAAAAAAYRRGAPAATTPPAKRRSQVQSPAKSRLSQLRQGFVLGRSGSAVELPIMMAAANSAAEKSPSSPSLAESESNASINTEDEGVQNVVAVATKEAHDNDVVGPDLSGPEATSLALLREDGRVADAMYIPGREEMLTCYRRSTLDTQSDRLKTSIELLDSQLQIVSLWALRARLAAPTSESLLPPDSPLCSWHDSVAHEIRWLRHELALIEKKNDPVAVLRFLRNIQESTFHEIVLTLKHVADRVVVDKAVNAIEDSISVSSLMTKLQLSSNTAGSMDMDFGDMELSTRAFPFHFSLISDSLTAIPLVGVNDYVRGLFGSMFLELDIAVHEVVEAKSMTQENPDVIIGVQLDYLRLCAKRDRLKTLFTKFVLAINEASGSEDPKLMNMNKSINLDFVPSSADMARVSKEYEEKVSVLVAATADKPIDTIPEMQYVQLEVDILGNVVSTMLYRRQEKQVADVLKDLSEQLRIDRDLANTLPGAARSAVAAANIDIDDMNRTSAQSLLNLSELERGSAFLHGFLLRLGRTASINKGQLSIPVADLLSALDALAARVLESVSGEGEGSGLKNIWDKEVVGALKIQLESAAEHVHYLEWLREQDLININNRVKLEVGHRNRELIIKLRSLERRCEQLESMNHVRENEIVHKTRAEYEALVRDLAVQVVEARQSANEHALSLQTELLSRVTQAKVDSLKALADGVIGEDDNSHPHANELAQQLGMPPIELRTRAIRTLRTEDELARLRDENYNLSLVWLKSRSFNRLRDMALRRSFQNRYTELQLEYDKLARQRAQSEVDYKTREDTLRNLLDEAQASLAQSQTKVESLKREVELQATRKLRLAHWKVVMGTREKELRMRISQLETAKNLHAESLVETVQKKEREIRRLRAELESVMQGKDSAARRPKPKEDKDKEREKERGSTQPSLMVSELEKALNSERQVKREAQEALQRAQVRIATLEQRNQELAIGIVPTIRPTVIAKKVKHVSAPSTPADKGDKSDGGLHIKSRTPLAMSVLQAPMPTSPASIKTSKTKVNMKGEGEGDGDTGEIIDSYAAASAVPSQSQSQADDATPGYAQLMTLQDSDRARGSDSDAWTGWPGAPPPDHEKEEKKGGKVILLSSQKKVKAKVKVKAKAKAKAKTKKVKSVRAKKPQQQQTLKTTTIS